MSKTNNCGPAFPTGTDSGVVPGMTLRDYFAAKAMQSLILAAAGSNGSHTLKSVAGAAYETADAMLAARSAAALKEQPAQDDDGWIKWKGGECPVSGDVEVEYRLRNGDEGRIFASDLEWEILGDSLDIVAYRVVGGVKP